MADDPLANSGSFFGMTTLGATDPFFDNAATTLHYPFHEIPMDAYTDVFDAYKLGGSSDIAATLGVDGETHVLRSKLGDMLNMLLGRQARKTELQAWFTCIDFDRGCLLSLQEYELAVQLLRDFSAAPQKARQYSSYEVWRADWLRNRRVAWEPTRAFQQPLTTAQQVGWHCNKPHIPAGEKKISLTHTDVTKGEGRCAASYYGAALGS